MSTPEHDSAGLPFDPERHLPKLHPKTGRWMPKKPKGAHKARVTTAEPPPAEISAPDTAPAVDTTTPAPPVDVAEKFAAIDEAFASIPPPAAEPTPGATPQEATPAPSANVELVEMSDDVAEIIATAFYNLAGFVFDAPEEWALTGNEHNRTRRAIAAYVRTRGGSIGPGKAVLILGAAYVLRGLAKPTSRKKARAAFATLRGHLFPKKAGRVAAPEQPTPTAPKAAPAAPQIISLSDLHNG